MVAAGCWASAAAHTWWVAEQAAAEVVLMQVQVQVLPLALLLVFESVLELTLV